MSRRPPGFWNVPPDELLLRLQSTIVQIKATAIRDKTPAEIRVEEIVTGDVVVLSAGDVIPGDCLILESRDLFVDEATLTGETYPVEKSAWTPKWSGNPGAGTSGSSGNSC